MDTPTPHAPHALAAFTEFAAMLGTQAHTHAPHAAGSTTNHSPNHEAAKHSLASAVRARVAQTVVGQDTVVDAILIAMLTGGHLLLQGVPGLAKTLLVNAVAKAIDLKFGRVQFTIDLLPADIVGSEVLDESTKQFRLHKGPVFTNLLLADEINRATPKVQSALLEAMQERRVTVGNQSLKLPTPFLVIATQNPIEQAGTFELPEAQLDRFMLCHRLNYPTKEQETEVVRRSLTLGLNRDATGGAVPKTAFDSISDEPVIRVAELTEAMTRVQDVHVSEVFVRHCVDLVDKTRSHPDLELGCSPRAGIALVQAARARAFILGRDYASPDDLFALAPDVMMHRMRPTYDALARGRSARAILDELLGNAG